MDEIVNRAFFRSMIHWEKKFSAFQCQLFNTGPLENSRNLTCPPPIIWHTKPELDESKERGIEKHNGTFSFRAGRTPYLRNTNCDLPAYFICYVEYPDAGESSGEETTTEEEETTTMGPVNPEDMPGPLEPVSPEEAAELEEKFANETEGFNHSCTTSDKDDVLTGRNGIIGSRWRWTKQYGFTVYIDPNYSSNDRKRINIALDNLRKVVCIPFYLFRRNQRPYGDYVHVQNLGNGRCHSAIGRQGGGQTMSLGRGCTEVGTIMHEMMHALGCYHEQSRPDRDNYIIIYWNNIIPHLRSQFQKAGGTSSWGIPYNTRSVMHYPADAFSSNGRIVIAAKNGGRVGGNVLTREDKQLLRKMYNCDSG
ncbi:Zinc metalloproteinase nas-6 [Orchesella cincta]|uniref:Metalloendopeptidase n=1 Tax=Orchesella cincta TaxID=48709 RepID=A0A1D2MAH6_ORCCI|nr:Zinc metalloproteinase nas-6 [Orchesella cincta]